MMVHMMVLVSICPCKLLIGDPLADFVATRGVPSGPPALAKVGVTEQKFLRV